MPAVDFAQFGPVKTEPLSRIQRISGPRLHASWVNIPHVTQFDEADITELEQLRASLKDKAQAAGVKLTPLAFIMRACVKALQEFPRFNSALDPGGANLIVRQYVHIGFAADTPQGLIVPVVKDAEPQGHLRAGAPARARCRRRRAPASSRSTDMQGGCFTISSLGGIGGTAFTPIINAPEVAILGRLALQHARRLPRRRLRAAPDAAAVAVLRSPGDRWRDGGALHELPRADARRAARADRGGAVSVDLLVPDIGNFTDVAVVDVLVKPGDVVELETPLVTHRDRQGLDGRAGQPPPARSPRCC